MLWNKRQPWKQRNYKWSVIKAISDDCIDFYAISMLSGWTGTEGKISTGNDEQWQRNMSSKSSQRKKMVKKGLKKNIKSQSQNKRKKGHFRMCKVLDIWHLELFWPLLRFRERAERQRKGRRHTVKSLHSLLHLVHFTLKRQDAKKFVTDFTLRRAA